MSPQPNQPNGKGRPRWDGLFVCEHRPQSVPRRRDHPWAQYPDRLLPPAPLATGGRDLADLSRLGRRQCPLCIHHLLGDAMKAAMRCIGLAHQLVEIVVLSSSRRRRPREATRQSLPARGRSASSEGHAAVVGAGQSAAPWPKREPRGAGQGHRTGTSESRSSPAARLLAALARLKQPHPHGRVVGSDREERAPACRLRFVPTCPSNSRSRGARGLNVD
jgi:hypothetical protein